MNNAFLALTAAGLAGLSGFGISSQTTPIQTAQVVTAAPDYSQEAGVYSQWLNADAPQCVAVSKIGLGVSRDEADAPSVSVRAGAVHRHPADLPTTSAGRSRGSGERPMGDR